MYEFCMKAGLTTTRDDDLNLSVNHILDRMYLAIRQQMGQLQTLEHKMTTSLGIQMNDVGSLPVHTHR